MIEKDIVEWIFELFDEIEEPTVIDRIQVVSFLSAEVESWSTESKKDINTL